MPFQITILTLFPDFFAGPLTTSIVKRAQQDGHVSIRIVNIRDFTHDKHQTADDRPYGGGAGMVMMLEPIVEALQSLGVLDAQGQKIANQKRRVLLTSAKGRQFTQAIAHEYAQLEELIIICGHYEGVDERVVEHCIDEEIRIGEYVLTGGEPAATVIADATTRLLPGVLGNAGSLLDESHNQPGYLASPQYTRPAEAFGWKVPEVLQNGNHAEIEKWRAEQSKTK